MHIVLYKFVLSHSVVIAHSKAFQFLLRRMGCESLSISYKYY